MCVEHHSLCRRCPSPWSWSLPAVCYQRRAQHRRRRCSCVSWTARTNLPDVAGSAQTTVLTTATVWCIACLPAASGKRAVNGHAWRLRTTTVGDHIEAKDVEMCRPSRRTGQVSTWLQLGRMRVGDWVVPWVNGKSSPIGGCNRDYACCANARSENNVSVTMWMV